MSIEEAINTVVKRLEAVTNRLEKIEKQIGSAGSSGNSSVSSSSSSSSGDSTASVRDWDELVNSTAKSLFTAASSLGGDVANQGKLLEKAFNEERNIISAASVSKKPSDSELQSLAQPLQNALAQITEIKEKSRDNKLANHLSAISDGVNALLWVMVTPKPGPHVADTREAAQFYINRILKDHKGEEPHVTFANQWNNFLKQLEAYIKSNHTTGLSWNSKGGSLTVPKSSTSTSTSSSSSSGGGGPPPPPPPPPPSMEYLMGSSSSNNNNHSDDNQPDMGGIFAQINSGNVTSGLKKVTKDMKSKNNPNKSGVVSAVEKKTTSTNNNKPAAQKQKKPPRLELEGQKWFVEFQDGNREAVIDANDIKETVYIYRCENSTIQVKGKINSIMIDGCKKTAVVFENCIAACEIVNCNRLEVQCSGKVPSVSVDKTSGCQLYLSNEGAPETDIITSESSEINITIPKDEANLVEFAVPTQYMSKYNPTSGELHTEVVKHTGV